MQSGAALLSFSQMKPPFPTHARTHSLFHQVSTVHPPLLLPAGTSNLESELIMLLPSPNFGALGLNGEGMSSFSTCVSTRNGYAADGSAGESVTRKRGFL